ncbi:hypothetical protein AAC387_Pa03g2728 [Persea americana]
MAAMISSLFHLGGKVPSQQQVVLTQTTADDQKVINQIIEAHKPDANFAVDEKPLLSMVMDILSQATPTPPQDPKIDSMVPEAKSLPAISEELAFTIHKIGCELSCECSGGGDMKSITQAVFNKLMKYTWEDKAVIALAAFAVNYGEFCLLSQLQSGNPLANYVVQLKPLPDVNEQESLISGLLEVITSVIKIIIQLNDLPTQYISRKEPPFSEPEVSNAVYWVVKGIVACSTQSIGLMNLPYMVSITEARKRLTELTHTLKKIHGNLTTMLDQCNQKIKEKKENEGYYNIKKVIESFHTDNVEIFIELIQTTDNTPLFNGVTGKKESLNVLKGNTVILFISNLDISVEEIKEIEHQVGKPGRQYEIVWLPIFHEEVTPKEREEIGKKASLMKWYSLHFSLTLQPYVVKYIKQDWQFEKKPMMVAFDARGKVVNSNAYHMLMIWGSAAYPFNTPREETLWKETDLGLDFLIGDKEPVNEGKVTYLYGGDDLDWIRKFILFVKDVVKGDGIIVELIYVGTKHRDTILKENLSKCWDDLQIRRFRTRLERIWYSKMHLGKPTADDTQLKYLTMLRGADGSGHPWTMVGQGPKEVVAVNGYEMVECLIELKNKKVSFPTTDFIRSLLKGIREIIFRPPGGEIKPKPKPKPHCYHIEAPSTNGIVQESMVCTDCNRPMEKTIMFKCCIKE